MIRFYTAGESHGKALNGYLEGLPSGLSIDEDFIKKELERRRSGFGRSARQKEEEDKFKILSGVFYGRTTGAPIIIEIKNIKKDPIMHSSVPRPGHADFAGAMKFGIDDLSMISERASGRETAARVAIGAIAKLYLAQFDIIITSFVHQIGNVVLNTTPYPLAKREFEKIDINQLIESTENNSMRCPVSAVEKQMKEQVERAMKNGDSVGGAFTLLAYNIPPGLGSYIQWDQKIDGQLARALMSIQGVKGVEFGSGFGGISKRGSEFHDAIYYDKDFYRKRNSAGGIEGGMTNGEPIIIRCAVKPPSSLKKPLPSVDIKTKKPAFPEPIRSDTCFVPAAGVVAEAMVALVLAEANLA
ncbi:chorismate synthase [bacterium]|nr:chorismate synthase [bacterium]